MWANIPAPSFLSYVTPLWFLHYWLTHEQCVRTAMEPALSGHSVERLIQIKHLHHCMAHTEGKTHMISYDNAQHWVCKRV